MPHPQPKVHRMFELIEPIDTITAVLREVGKGLYAWSFAHTVRIDKDDNIWAVDKGSDMIIKFNQAGRVMMVFGRRQESADGAEPWEHPNPPLPPQLTPGISKWCSR